MSVPSDDLPRSPSGRVPQWVADEAAGVATSPDGWRVHPLAPPPPERPRRSLVARLLSIVLFAAVGAWGAVTLLPPALEHVDAPWLDTYVVGRVPEPTAEVAALADEMFLTDEGRDVLYRARPRLLGASELAGACARDDSAAEPGGGSVVGCYHGPSGAARADASIAIYEPADARLRGFVVETAGHELLHAAWLELTPGERAEATGLLEQVVAGLDPADEVHAQIAGSVGPYAEKRATEHFAYVGTQVWQPGGLHPRLEELWGRFVADRGALVAVHTGLEGMLDGMVAEVTAAQGALTAQSLEHHTAQAQLDADTATLESYRGVVEQEEAHLAAMSAGERARWRLSWTWIDGTKLPMAPAAETLAQARALLVRDEAALAQRAEAVRIAGEAVAAEEARVAALRADVEALYAQLAPGAAAGG
ncbi:hypothetical protein [Cellulomonas shaoxiangyii]|uniref:Uncharacterized protein n=1 Tax=Cellulomonas shaoxiangyii TaxID=2566013 RepID=A0A4P7SFS1_9CELL|nr:hypothetical protein [Cellulomonas shaoxiangyii]QCB92347.1 hypothetical protein E5225_01015 [Cellulomonas shaoxiangyii]TGY86258.1 hypothetical protein E5226_02850 [Cellulomonas shaoxiangyii]